MTGISIIGGVAHNIGQFLVAAFVTKTFGVFSYLPVLLIAGTVAGALIGLLGRDHFKKDQQDLTERIKKLFINY